MHGFFQIVSPLRMVLCIFIKTSPWLSDFHPIFYINSIWTGTLSLFQEFCSCYFLIILTVNILI